MRKLNASIVIGLIVAFLGASTVYAYGRSVDRRAAQGKEVRTVLVASTPLSAGMSVGDVRSKVREVRMPAGYAVADALVSLDDVTRTGTGDAVLLTDVPKGGQLARSSFGDPALAGRLSPAAGHVALAVQTDISPGVARYLAAGSLVDVFVTYRNVSDSSGRPALATNRTKLFVSGVKVLAVSVAQQQGQRTKSDSTLAPAQQEQDKVVAVLELTPSDAERLVNATTLGSIYLGYTAKGGDRTATGVVPDDVVAGSR